MQIQVSLLMGALLGAYLGQKGTISMAITGAALISYTISLLGLIWLFRYFMTRFRIGLLGFFYHAIVVLGIALFSFLTRAYLANLLLTPSFDALMLTSALHHVLTDGPQLQFPTWDFFFMDSAQPGHGAPEQPDVAQAGNGNPPVNLDLEAQRRLEFYTMTQSSFLDQIKDWPGFSIQLQVVEDCYFVQSTIENELVAGGVNPAMIAENRGNLRDLLFYHKTHENELLSPQTIHRYVASIRENGTRDSIPYRKVLRAVNRGDISFFDMAASRERMLAICRGGR